MFVMWNGTCVGVHMCVWCVCVCMFVVCNGVCVCVCLVFGVCVFIYVLETN